MVVRASGVSFVEACLYLNGNAYLPHRLSGGGWGRPAVGQGKGGVGEVVVTL